MSKKKKQKNNQKTNPPTEATLPVETRTSESLTVLWAMTVLMVLVMNLACIGAHYYLVANPDAEKMRLLKGLLLFTGSLVGGLSLIVLPILYRIRKVPPPSGLAVFGACVAVAPILAAIAFAAE